jgi:hypothetical protein
MKKTKPQIDTSQLAQAGLGLPYQKRNYLLSRKH